MSQEKRVRKMSSTLTLAISYGDGVHSIKLSRDDYAEIKEGGLVEIEGQGFIHEEDGLMTDYWIFNRYPGEIMFWLDNDAEFYARDFWIEE